MAAESRRRNSAAQLLKINSALTEKYMDTKTHIRRLKQLYKLGEKLPSVKEQAFKMDTWGIKPGAKKVKHGPDNPKMDCGFAACALGWCPVLVPESRRSGLKAHAIRRADRTAFVIMYKERTGEHAAADYFGIDLEESKELFTPWYSHQYCHLGEGFNPSAAVVGERIRIMAAAKLSMLGVKI